MHQYSMTTQRALQVISKLLGITTEEGERYGRFIDAWFQVYEKVRPTIDAADLGGCPYKVRVLDRILWHLGQPSFNIH